MTANVMGAADARSSFFDILDKVSRLRRIFTITKKGKARAVIMSAEEFEEWAETLEIMASPRAMKGIRKGLRELRSGRHLKHADVFKARR